MCVFELFWYMYVDGLFLCIVMYIFVVGEWLYFLLYDKIFIVVVDNLDLFYSLFNVYVCLR